MRISIIILVLLFLGCKTDKFEYDYYENGSIKEKFHTVSGLKEGLCMKYDIDENLVSETTWNKGELNGIAKYYTHNNLSKLCVWKNGKIEGTYQEFHQNGELFLSGYYNNNFPIGIFSYFDETGTLTGIKEYLVIDSSSFLNQVVNFDVKGDTIYSESNFFFLSHKDTINIGEELPVNISLVSPYFMDSKMFVFLDDINDTTKYRRLYSGNYNVSFEIANLLKGRQIINGFIDEIKENKNSSDSIKISSRRLYFNSEVFVE